MSEQKFIIMEQQVNLREVLVFYVESTFGFTPLRATNSKEAIQYLTNSDVVLVLCGTGDHVDEASLLTNYCSQFLSKNPILFHPLNNLLAPKSVKKEDVDKSEITEDKTNIQVLIEKLNGFFKINPDGPKKEFTSISIDSLPFFNGITSDLFIKLQSDRYIKLFKDGDVVNNSDVAKYKNKGVLQLYLKKECCFWTLKQIENKLSEIRDDENKTVDVNMDSIREMMNVHEETYVKVKENVELIKTKLKKNSNLKQNLLGLELDRKIESYAKERIELISFISCGIANELSWGSEESYEKLIMAANLHDILLWEKPILAILRTEKDLEKVKHLFSPEEQLMFKYHPQSTAEILEKRPEIPSEVIFIIKQHHELPDGCGFPDKLNYARLRPYSCLFIVALDLATYILTNKNWTIEKFVSDRETLYKGSTFNKIMPHVRALKNFKTIKR